MEFQGALDNQNNPVKEQSWWSHIFYFYKATVVRTAYTGLKTDVDQQ